MSAIFLSASVPILGRGTYHETADPFLIQSAVREFVTFAVGRALSFGVGTRQSRLWCGRCAKTSA